MTRLLGVVSNLDRLIMTASDFLLASVLLSVALSTNERVLLLNEAPSWLDRRRPPVPCCWPLLPLVDWLIFCEG